MTLGIRYLHYARGKLGEGLAIQGIVLENASNFVYRTQRIMCNPLNWHFTPICQPTPPSPAPAQQFLLFKARSAASANLSTKTSPREDKKSFALNNKRSQKSLSYQKSHHHHAIQARCHRCLHRRRRRSDFD
jgi:hypothetical protein